MRFTSAHRPGTEGAPPAAAPDRPEPEAEIDAPDEGTPADHEPAVTEPHVPPGPAPPQAPPPVVVPRWIQLVVLPLALLGLWALARASGTVLLVLIVAVVIAIILNPVVKALEHVIPRGLAILAVYIGAFAALAGVVILLADPIATQIGRFTDNLPQLAHQATKELNEVQRWLDRNGIKVQIEKQGQSALTTLENGVKKNSDSIVSFSKDVLGQVITTGFDAILVLVLSVYLLVYAGRIGEMVRRLMPPGDGTPHDDYPHLIQRAVLDYVRGQLTFSFIMGASTALCMYLVGVLGVFPDGRHYALFFGGFYGLMELIPYIGPIVGALPPLLVALFADPVSALWVALVFVGLQQLEGHVIAPQVFRISLQINPILIILSLLIGYQLYGIVGALVALPLAAMARQTIVYLRRHLVLEPWSANAPPLLGLQGEGPTTTPPGGGASSEAPADTGEQS
jgi:predicted PurR-regulated permease PerM